MTEFVGRHVEDVEQIELAGASAIELITDLIGGLPIHAVYQPIVDLNDGHVIGYEALARPQGYGASDSVEGLFEVAHRSGQIRDLDWLCRRAALGQAASLPANALLFINVSVAALVDPLHDVDQLMLLLEWSGRSPRNLVLEIGEHEDVRDLQRFQHVLAAYRTTGVRFAIDDLGEGFATTDLLASAGAEYVKLARSSDHELHAARLTRRDPSGAELRASEQRSGHRRGCRERAHQRSDPVTRRAARAGLRTGPSECRKRDARHARGVERARDAPAAASAERADAAHEHSLIGQRRRRIPTGPAAGQPKLESSVMSAGDRPRGSRAPSARQEPLDPDEVFSALITRLIATNEEERASRNSNGAPATRPRRIARTVDDAPEDVPA